MGQIVWTDASFNIVLSNPDGSNQHVVVPNHPSVTTPVVYNSPDLSPDGKKIVMAGSRAGAQRSSQLYIAGSDGSAPRRAAESGTIQYWPRWSPDGTQIACAELEGANGVRDLVVMDADGSSPKVIIGNADRPSWSPDGLSLLFQSSGKIMVINTDRSQLRALADGVGPGVWSADGSQIAFQQVQSRGVRVLKTGGTSQTVTDAAVSLQSWSPDGRHLLVIASPSGNPPGDLQVIDAATGAVQQTLASNVVDASWQRPRP
jgi:TolB protein